jgi:hypothetical protein
MASAQGTSTRILITDEFADVPVPEAWLQSDSAAEATLFAAAAASGKGVESPSHPQAPPFRYQPLDKSKNSIRLLRFAGLGLDDETIDETTPLKVRTWRREHLGVPS